MKGMIWCDKDYGITVTWFVLSLWILGFAVQAIALSHTETYLTYRLASRLVWVCPGSYRRRRAGPPSSECYYDHETSTEAITNTRCQSGWTPYPACNEINECTQGIATCGQICTDTVSSYICSCNSGYRLASDGRKCNDIDECQEGTSGCEKYCSNTPGNYRCSCDAGYALASNGRSCSDINECNERTSQCAQNCYNSVGSYRCECNSGFQLAADGLSCNDIDECASQIEYCTVPNSFTCENTIGDYRCICWTGFEQVGPHECRDINECETATNNCTLYENTTCENINGSYKCGRPVGVLMSESTAKLIIIVTVCVVAGVALIIIAVVCFIIYAKKRKINEGSGKGAPKETANEESTSGNVNKGEEKKDLKTGITKNESNYQELAAATKQKNYIYEAIR